VAKVITARFVETVRPKATRFEIPDAACPGLYLIVQALLGVPVPP
jgi:hypothetical protein